MGSAREHAMERRQKPKGLGLPVGNRRRPTGTPVPRRNASPITPIQARTAYAEMMRRRVEARNKQKPTGTPVPQAKQKPTGTPIPPKRSRGRRPDTARARAMREFNANRLKSKGKPVVQKQVVVPKAEPVKAPPTPKGRGRRPDTARARAAREFNANRIAAGSKNPTSKKTFART